MVKKKTFNLKAEQKKYKMAGLSGTSDITLKESRIFTLLCVAGVTIISVVYFLGGLVGLGEFAGAAATTMATIIACLRVIMLAYEKRDKMPDRMDKVYFLVPTLSFLVGLFLFFNVLYNSGLFAMFSPDWIIQLYWYIGLSYLCVLGVVSLRLYKTMKEKKWNSFWMYFAYAVVPIIPMCFLFFGAKSIVPAGAFFLIGSIAIGLLFVTWVWKLPKEDRLKLGLIYGVFLLASLLMIGIILNPFFPEASVRGALQDIIVSGQAGEVDYFALVWEMLFQEAASVLMISIMVFGAVVNIFTLTLGGSKLARGLGNLIMVFPAMLIIFEMWTGGIPPPCELLNYDGRLVHGGCPLCGGFGQPTCGPLPYSLASIIYAICETGVFAIMGTLLAYFQGFTRELTVRMGIYE